MKSILYFILAVLTIIYIGFLCYVNIIGLENIAQALNYVAIYGGLAISLTYAAINFFGSPLKTVFFILLVIAVVVLILTIALPDSFRGLFGLTNENESTEAFLRLFNK